MSATLNEIKFLSRANADTITATDNNKLYLVETPVIVETYVNGTEWYRVWSDGWIEQGGIKATPVTYDSSVDVTFYKTLQPSYGLFLTAIPNCTTIIHLYKIQVGLDVDGTDGVHRKLLVMLFGMHVAINTHTYSMFCRHYAAKN